MDAALLKTLLKPTLSAAALATALTAGGCCGPGLLSRRHAEPTCGAVTEDAGVDVDLSLRRGIPVMAWPNIPMPGCLQRERWRQRTSEFAADFNEFLEPTPPPPAKPPHSRFHPVPTQPVFASRAEYAARELLGLEKQPHDASLPHTELPLGEEIPIPIPIPDASSELGWKELPPSGVPLVPDAPVPDDKLHAPPKLQQPPTLKPPAADPSRGNVAPASFLRVAEPNPLRPIR